MNENRYRLIYNVVILLLLSGSELYSQKQIEPSKIKQFDITVNFNDHTVKTQMLSQNKSIEVRNDCVYMWYAFQKIMETKGGYDGRLVHGSYRSFYLNNQLREQGKIRYGLKNGRWKYWYPNGHLKEAITWKKGKKNGSYYLYNEYGQLIAKSNFKNDKLHGNFFTYSVAGKVIDRKKYRRGEEKLPKTKQAKSKSRFKFKNKKASDKDQMIEDKLENPVKKEKIPLLQRVFRKRAGIEKKPKEKSVKLITS